MNLNFNQNLLLNYHSPSQVARVITEAWVGDNMFCPRCGNAYISHFPNNKPVADFYCPKCSNEYELKSKNGSISKKINDGSYEMMIERIKSDNNPDFFFLEYSKSQMKVKNFVLIPKHFFIPEIIEKRKPLADTARRAGWVGCNIILEKIPKQGVIDIVKNEIVLDTKDIVEKTNKAYDLQTDNLEMRGWLFDILNCVNSIPKQGFSLTEIYDFEGLLYKKHPNNNNIKAKIRQQLQLLRDKGFIEFLGNGVYRKVV